MSGLDIFALIVLIVLLLAVLVIWIVLAMLPGKIARQRNHPQAEAINVGGWVSALLLGVMWPFVLVWAFTRPQSAESEQAVSDGESGDEVSALRDRVAGLEAKLAAGGD